MNQENALLLARRLAFSYGRQQVFAEVDLSIARREIVCLIGASGCGKSTLLRLLAGLAEPTAGEVSLHERSGKARAAAASVVFQSPALLPWLTVADNVAFGLDFQCRAKESRGQRQARVTRALAQVGLTEHAAKRPQALSGGMAQRVAIALAIAAEPRLLIADEPTTALDVTIQAQILELLLDLQRERGMALLLISHDLAVVAECARRVCVMYAGQAVEVGELPGLFDAPAHPYTRGLLNSLPRVDRNQDVLVAIEGTVPALHELPGGCHFAPRCTRAVDPCRKVKPPMQVRENGHCTACFNPES